MSYLLFKLIKLLLCSRVAIYTVTIQILFFFLQHSSQQSQNKVLKKVKEFVSTHLGRISNSKIHCCRAVTLLKIPVFLK